MAELGGKLGEQLGGLATKWTGYAALGSGLVYLFGYLALRSQLSVYGVAVGIDGFDEKYLFAGGRFCEYLVTTIPSILMLAIVLLLLTYVPFVLIPGSVKTRVKAWLVHWSSDASRLSILGVVLAVLFIQYVERQCFVFDNNLLLLKRLPEMWISGVLMSNQGRLALYFAGLVVGTLLSGAILCLALRCENKESGLSRSLVTLLGFLFAVEVLFLPVNFGILISTQLLPRVADVTGEPDPPGGRTSWLLWDSKDAITYLVRDPGDQRMLVTVPAKEARIRILAYDNILCVLFCEKNPEDTHSQPEATK
jgi:hypothetical protein